MPKFTYSDIVRVREVDGLRKAWIVGIFEKTPTQGSYFDKFLAGTIYTVEFEDGASTEFHEDVLELWE